MIDQALLNRSHLENIQLPDGRWLVRGLLARDAVDATQLRARHEQHDAADEIRRQQRRRGDIGRRVPTGTIWRTRHDDGEITYDTIHVTTEPGGRYHLTITTDPGIEVHTTAGIDWALVRRIAAWIAARRTSLIDTTEHDAHDALRALTQPLLQHHPIPAAPWLATGPDTTVGAITIPSLITPGVAIWTTHDWERSTEMSADERRDGGLVIAVSLHPQGRIFTVLRENVPAASGGLRGLKIGHIHERDVHWCETENCLSCPQPRHQWARRLYRRCHLPIGSQPHRHRPLTDDEAVLVQVATVLRSIT